MSLSQPDELALRCLSLPCLSCVSARGPLAGATALACTFRLRNFLSSKFFLVAVGDVKQVEVFRFLV